MPGDDWQKFANLRLLYAYMWGHPGKKLLFMGSEFGQRREWDYASSLQWDDLHGPEGKLHSGVQTLVRDLNSLYRGRAALYERDFDWEGFEWIDFSDADNSVIAFLRRTHDRTGTVIFLLNMTPVVRYGYRVGLPQAGVYRETISTDARQYGGSGVENWGDIEAEAVPWHGQSHSAIFTLPPLGASIVEPVTR
jgi:1,4-alpha-glucan branching enzyme